jgi:methyl-accepting chemotaxis protein
MKLEIKLALSTGALVLAMLLSAFFAQARMKDATVLSDRTAEKRLPLLLSVIDARRNVLKSQLALESDILFGLTEEAASRYRGERAKAMFDAQAAMDRVQTERTLFDVGEDGPRLDRLLQIFNELRPLQERIERLNASRQPEQVAEAYALLQHEESSLMNGLLEIGTSISDSGQAKIVADSAALARANRSTLITLWGATLVGALLGAFISWFMSRRITEAIAEVASRANAIAGGDLTGHELVSHSNDQIGMLADAMNQMQTSLSSIIGTVADTAGSLTGSAASMRSASDQMHRRIDQQSQQTQQAATAMQEMSASIAEVSRHTQSAAETARGAAQTARDGGTIVKQMLSSMHEIATAVADTSSTVGLLGDDSKRISQIVTVIDEIARKTNLLALNAAIEAARAGDQGRGFAVVAGEVRRLAESTAQATGEIAAMIQEIQDRTRRAIASMESGTGTVRDGVVTTTQAGEALERIIGMAERVDRMITQIAIAASQQATAADQSSASLDSIHSLSDENLTEMATTTAGIESLRGTAVTLENQVDRFQVLHGVVSNRRAA